MVWCSPTLIFRTCYLTLVLRPLYSPHYSPSRAHMPRALNSAALHDELKLRRPREVLKHGEPLSSKLWLLMWTVRFELWTRLQREAPASISRLHPHLQTAACAVNRHWRVTTFPLTLFFLWAFGYLLCVCFWYIKRFFLYLFHKKTHNVFLLSQEFR